VPAFVVCRKCVERDPHTTKETHKRGLTLLMRAPSELYRACTASQGLRAKHSVSKRDPYIPKETCKRDLDLLIHVPSEHCRACTTSQILRARPSVFTREVGGWGRDPFSRNFMKPTPRRKWYLSTGRRFH